MVERWGLLCGSWGDVICSLENFYQSGAAKALYYGYHAEIADFLSIQPFIKAVKHIIPRNQEFNRYFLSMACDSHADIRRVLASELTDSGLEVSLVKNTVSKIDSPSEGLTVGNSLLLPEESLRWASTLAQEINQPFYILQPFSFNSCGKDQHWPHWEELIMWLDSNDANFYALAGQNFDPQKYIGKTIINLVDKIPSLPHLLALSELSSGAITTCNSLSHWMNFRNLPMVVALNQRCGDENDYFRIMLTRGNGRIVDYFDTMGHAKSTCREMFRLGK